MTSTQQTNLDKALFQLVALMSQGWEWPDAHAKACVTYKVDGEALNAAYDEHAELIPRPTRVAGVKL